ncbi:TonB-dependent receptor plug domain-containing protein [Caulobacter segnis]
MESGGGHRFAGGARRVRRRTPVDVLGAGGDQGFRASQHRRLRQHPAVRGGQFDGAANSSGALSNGAAGISALNLRSLGTGRTLVLFDGQRSVVSASTGQVDTNTFPQSLISRVEVVTGGASSAYGSDAIGGVVNFILDKNYTGIKSSVEYGETTCWRRRELEIQHHGQPGGSFANGEEPAPAGHAPKVVSTRKASTTIDTATRSRAWPCSDRNPDTSGDRALTASSTAITSASRPTPRAA